MEMEPSTSGESQHLYHEQNVEYFGEAAELNEDCLPTFHDILKYYFLLYNRANNEEKHKGYKNFTTSVLDKVIEVWSKLPIKTIHKKSVYHKLNKFMETYQKEDKNLKQHTKSLSVFIDSLKNIFDISVCRCKLEINNCSCGVIPFFLREFMLDQLNSSDQFF